ncbi:transglutaminase domain-containing protein [[Clostridium] polysaccharolyticum]|uniref:Transglutaminase-like superfamily protein n=1 Tax=[Clostridium] polysaccharolyticum TaxID=29364 RepID=A0A1I0E7I7_9FIRM|nr:transglutaminase domain-containing protein [[Clostridium] polysaccharolyticum]SET40952.1 Transglutaminase-like superfamily protein [[Clostridium] polysaccharolyticum]
MYKQRKGIQVFVMVFVLLTQLISNQSFVYAASKKAAVKKQSVRTLTVDDDFIQKVYKKIVQRSSSFSIKYNGDWRTLNGNGLDVILDRVYAIDNKSTSDDFDYLKENVKQYSLRISTNGVTSTLTFSISYRETKEQTQKVNKTIKSKLNSMNLDKVSDYQKIKKIHNFIVNRVSYDQKYTKYTAYDALYKKEAVCQGYALLFYKMATEAGIPCRIVTSASHAWNIVKLEDKWYHVDVTWDDPVSDKPVLRYDYFLKGTKSMADVHVLNREFQTREFQKAYPISNTDYKKS